MKREDRVKKSIHVSKIGMEDLAPLVVKLLNIEFEMHDEI